MPMELRKRKAPAAPAPPPPAPKRKATAPKKDKKIADAAAEAKPAAKKAAAAKAAKAAEKAEVTTEPPTAAAADAEIPAAKPAAKPKAEKETKPAKKEEKPKDKKEKEKAAPSTKEKKETAPKAKEDKPEAEKKEKKAASKSATATPAPSSSVDLKAGDALPTELPEVSNHAGEKVTLPGLLDASKTGIVIFAYPAAITPGCTRQAILFNASKDAFEAQGYSVFGLSGDKPEKNLKFKEKEKLTYPLLSDVDYSLHKKLGIHKPGGKSIRSSIVISKDGKIVAIKKAGPEDTVKSARAACELPAEDSKTNTAEKKIEAEEAPDAAT